MSLTLAESQLDCFTSRFIILIALKNIFGKCIFKNLLTELKQSPGLLQRLRVGLACLMLALAPTSFDSHRHEDALVT